MLGWCLGWVAAQPGDFLPGDAAEVRLLKDTAKSEMCHRQSTAARKMFEVGKNIKKIK